MHEVFLHRTTAYRARPTSPAWRVILALLAAILPQISRADAVAIEADAGLPDKFITAIAKDARGLMWIATRGGLCTFDGQRFDAGIQGIPSALPVSKILYQPATDRLWAATERGLYAVRCTAGTSAGIATAASWSRGPVADIALLPDGRLCAAYRSGELAVVEAADQLRLLTRLRNTPAGQPFATRLQLAGPDEISFGLSARDEPQLLSLRTGVIHRDATAPSHVSFLRPWRGDTLLIARAGGGLEIRRGRGAAPVFPAAAPLLATLRNLTDVRAATPASCYILCKQAELYFFDAVSNRLDTLASPAFAGKMGTCLYVDAGGLVWVGTNKGLVRVSPETSQYFATDLDRSPAASVRSLAIGETGALFAGTYSGLLRRAAGAAQWTKLSNDIAYALLNRPGRHLYFVTEGGEFCRVDKGSLRIDTAFYDAAGLPPGGLQAAYSLAADGAGRIWIGTRNGLARYDEGANRLAAQPIAGWPAGRAVIHVRPSRRGTLWLCTRAGLYEYDPGRGIVWRASTDTKPALSSAAVHFADEDRAGRLWVCTDGGGLNIISADRKTVNVLKTEAGLADNSTYQLLWQADGRRAWISTFNGLSAYTPAGGTRGTGTFHNFYTGDGLATNEFNHNAFLQDSAGRMLFGSIQGIAAFYPDSIQDAARHTRLFVSSIRKWDEKQGAFITLPPADTARTILLHPRDHSLTFTLALSDYAAPANQIFQYRIQGLFDDWVSLGSSRLLRLDGLRAGTYTLEIRATDSRGTPAANRLRYRIRVAQSFFASFWFYLLLFAVASGLLAGFFALRVRHLRRVQRLREQIASDLHDEVGSLLTRITITSDQLRYSRATEDEKTGKLQKIAALSRSAASSMSDILWAIDARHDYTGNLADRMREHAEEMLTPLEVQPEFDFAVNQRMQLPSALRQQLYLIFKEAVNNLVKHSRASHVRISYHHDEGGYTLRIANDGMPEKTRTSSGGQGLKNMRMRAAKVGGQAEAGASGGEFVVKVWGR